MPRRPQWPPPMKLHSSSGQARVRVWQDGQIIERYLGPYGSDEAKANYARFLSELTANQGRLPSPALPDGARVEDLLARFMTYANIHYRKPDGTPKSELASFRAALAPLLEGFGGTAAEGFGPKQLKQLQQRMAALGWCRRVINRNITRVRTAWRWLESEELVPAGTWNALRTVRGLAPGEAADHEAVLPVPEDVLAATLPQLGHVVRAIAETQLLTGARPGELLVLRPRDLIRLEVVDLGRGLKLQTRGCWVVLPEGHKTAYRGHRRLILFGPKAQELLQPFLIGREEMSYLFSPREAAESYLRSKGRNINHGITRRPGERYRVDSYDRAVKHACQRAGVEHWAPNRLRHNAATRLVEQFGWDVARIVLGHRSVEITKIYALDDLKKAIDAMHAAG